MRKDERGIEDSGADGMRRKRGCRSNRGRGRPFDEKARGKLRAGGGDPRRIIGVVHLMLVMMAFGVMLVRMDRPVLMPVNMGQIDRVGKRMSPNGAESPQEQRDGRSQPSEEHFFLITDAPG